MKICLIYPPNSKLESEIPVGLLSIASKLKADGYDVIVVDIAPLILKGLISNNKNIYSNIAEYLDVNVSADIYGFSTISTLEIPSLQISKRLKELNNNVFIVFGNQWASMNDVMILETFCHVNCIVRGEGEISFSDLVDTLYSGLDIRNVLGISFRRHNTVVRNSDRALIKDLDSLPAMNYSLLHFGLRDYVKMNRNHVGLIEGGRGCSYHCNFCSTSEFWHRTARMYSPQRIISEIRQLLSYEFKYLFFTYDNFGTFQKQSHDLFKLLIDEFNGNIDWFARCRIDCMNNETLSLMAKAGCKNILIGAESGSDKTLKIMKKGITVKQILSKINDIINVGITPKVSFLTGLPYENKTSVYHTIKLACELSLINDFLDSKIHFFSPLAGTEITRNAINKCQLEFSNSPLISPDMAQFLEWGELENDCFDNYVRLDEDQQLIDSYPQLFSSYGYVLNKYIGAQYFSSLSNYFNLLIERFPITTLFLLLKDASNKIDLVESFESFCELHGFKKKSLWSIRVFIDDRNAGLIVDFYDMFKTYVCHYSSKYRLLNDIYKYEDMIFKTLTNNKRTNNIINIDFRSPQNILSSKIELNGKIEKYEYAIHSLVERVKSAAFLQNNYKWSDWSCREDTYMASTVKTIGNNACLTINLISKNVYEMLRFVNDAECAKKAIEDYCYKFKVNHDQAIKLLMSSYKKMSDLFILK